MRLFLEGRHKDLEQELRARMEAASRGARASKRPPPCATCSHTVEEMDEKQKMAAAEGDDTDIFAYYAEPPLVAVNLFHLRRGQHRRPARVLLGRPASNSTRPNSSASLLKQVYLDRPYVPAFIHVPVEFEDRAVLEEYLTEKRGRKVEIHTPQRGQKKAMLALVESNAQHSFRAALPRDEAVLHSDSGSLAATPESGGSRPPDRVLRYLAHPGHRQGRQHGGVGRRPDEEVRLPQVHHPHAWKATTISRPCAK